jgi:integrase
VDPTVADVVIRPMLTINRAIDLFLGDLQRRGYSDRTRHTYSRILYKFDDRLPDDYDVSKITTDDVRRFLDTLSGAKVRGRGSYARGTQAHAESVLASFLKWLLVDGKITKNPMDRLARTRRIPSADLDVTTVSTDDVRKLMAAARSWSEKLAVGILVYMGPRRKAVALLRRHDFDAEKGRLRFREKGGKIIWKPVPDELHSLLAAACAAGLYETDDDYLVPPLDGGVLQRAGDRDDRVIWDIVHTVSDRAGVKTHVHALRAAFACFYLEQNDGDILGLQELLGHRSIETTKVYLRKLDKERQMAPVRSLSWGAAIEAPKILVTSGDRGVEVFD